MENVTRSWVSIYYAVYTLLIAGFLVNVILIAGVLKGRPKFFLPYLIFAYFQLVLLILRTANKFLRERFLGDVDIAVTIITPLIPLYFVICVHSYYVDVKKQQKEAKETVVSVVMPTSV